MKAILLNQSARWLFYQRCDRWGEQRVRGMEDVADEGLRQGETIRID